MTWGEIGTHLFAFFLGFICGFPIYLKVVRLRSNPMESDEPDEEWLFRVLDEKRKITGRD